MYYQKFVNILAERKLKLGMSESLIAHRASLSQPTVHRILSGQHHKTSWNDMIAIAEVLGLVSGSLDFKFQPVDEMLDNQATMLATAIVGINQATNQLEGQGLAPDEKEKLIYQSKLKLLTGPRGYLWMEI